MSRQKTRALSAPTRLFWVIVFILVASVGLSHISSTKIDDDNLMLAYAAVPNSDDARAIEGDLHRTVMSRSDCTVEAFRLGLRYRYVRNYAGYLLVGSSMYRVLNGADLSVDDVIIGGMMATKVTILIAALMILIWSSSRISDQYLAHAVGLALIALSLTDLLVATHHIPSYALADLGNPVIGLGRLAYSVVVAAEGHSPFGNTPRNAAIVLLASAMVLRWSGWPALAVLAVITAGMIHQTYGGLAIFLFAISTAVARPDMLSGTATRLLLVVAALNFAVRESYFSASSNWAIAIGAVIFTALGLWIVSTPFYLAIRRRLIGSAADREIWLDAAVYGLIALLCTLIALVGAASADQIGRLYLWSDLATRVWSLARFPFFVAGSACALRSIGQLSSERLKMAVATLGIVVALTQTDWSFGRAQSLAYQTAKSLPRNQRNILLPTNELFIYANLAQVAAGAMSADLFRRQLAAKPLRCGGKTL